MAAAVGLAALFARFLRLGALAFGGPVVQIAALHREVVEARRWVDAERFRRALAVYQVLPGPEATEMCVWAGMVVRGRVGAVLAGLGFVLPGAVLMLLLSAWYWQRGGLDPGLQRLFPGMQAVVVALVLRALQRLARHTCARRADLGSAGLALAATLGGAPFPPVLAGAAALHVAVRQRAAGLAALGVALLAGAAAYGLAAAPASAAAAAAAASPPGPLALLGEGLRAGLLTFGGAYTVLPFLREAAVGGGWLGPEQFLDGVALAGVLPAPMVIFAAFVGHGAGGWLGALAITAGVFAPAFAFTLLGHRWLEALTARPAVHRWLDGVAVGVVGIMAATAVQLAPGGLAGPRQWLVAAAAWLWLGWARHRLAGPVAVLAGAATGLLG